MWNPTAHSNDENLRWSWLRAVEWIGWPLFISQPVVPVLFYFYSWPAVIGGTMAATFVWRAMIVPFWVSPNLADIGPLFVLAKFVSAPATAYFLWQRGNTPIAVVALLWPFVGSAVAQGVLFLPTALMALTSLGKMSQIGVVQMRFLAVMGLQPTGDVAPEGR